VRLVHRHVLADSILLGVETVEAPTEGERRWLSAQIDAASDITVKAGMDRIADPVVRSLPLVLLLRACRARGLSRCQHSGPPSLTGKRATATRVEHALKIVGVQAVVRRNQHPAASRWPQRRPRDPAARRSPLRPPAKSGRVGLILLFTTAGAFSQPLRCRRPAGSKKHSAAFSRSSAVSPCQSARRGHVGIRPPG